MWSSRAQLILPIYYLGLRTVSILYVSLLSTCITYFGVSLLLWSMLNFFLPILACVADELIGSIRLLRCEVRIWNRIACLWLIHRESTLFKNFVHSDVAEVMPADSFIWKFVWIFVFVLKGNRKFIRPHRQTTKYTSCIWMKSSSFPFNITGLLLYIQDKVLHSKKMHRWTQSPKTSLYYAELC